MAAQGLQIAGLAGRARRDGPLGGVDLQTRGRGHNGVGARLDKAQGAVDIARAHREPLFQPVIEGLQYGSGLLAGFRRALGQHPMAARRQRN